MKGRGNPAPTAAPELIDSKLIFSNATEQKRQSVVKESKKQENVLDTSLQNFDKNGNTNDNESISAKWVDFFLDTSPSGQEININSLDSSQFDGVKSDTKAPVVNSASSELVSSSQLQPKPDDFKTFPVGVMVGQRNARASVLVRGEEDGAKAIEFDRWLLPYDVVINTLGLNVKNLSSEQVEISSPGIVTRINITELKKDPKLGLVFSVQDLQKYFGVNADFDIKEYAIRLNVPWSEYKNRPTLNEKPLILEGLPRLKAPTFGVSSVFQQVRVTGSDSQATKAQGDLNVVGTAFGGSWFLRANQFNLQNAKTWNLAEAQFLRQTDTADFIVGSQTPFWSNEGGRGDYWGFSTIQRRGFSSPNGVNNTLPQQRMQAAQLGRTISGRAEPGTLVRLVQNFTNRAVAEVLVDSDGIYEFENVLVDGQITITNYRLFLYPQGKLTAQPSIREVTFNNVPGQLPEGTSAQPSYLSTKVTSQYCVGFG